MTRCAKRTELEVYHVRREGGNGLDNAEVLCQKCSTMTTMYGAPGISPPPFDAATKHLALRLADNCCECVRGNGCH